MEVLQKGLDYPENMDNLEDLNYPEDSDNL